MPTIHTELRGVMVGTLRFAHPTIAECLTQGVRRHCERSEAIHRAACLNMDCFVAALLAMTS